MWINCRLLLLVVLQVMYCIVLHVWITNAELRDMITWVPSGFSGYIWLDTNKIVLKKSFIIIIYFENVHFFHTTLSIDVCQYEVPPSLNTAHSECKPSTFMSSFTLSKSSFPHILSSQSSRPYHLHLSIGRYPIIRIRIDLQKVEYLRGIKY